MAELQREGRKWEWAKLSEEEVHARLADCDAPLRDKVPDTVRDGDAGSGLLAMSALLWVVRRFDLLTGAHRRSVTSMDKVYVTGMKGLRTEMVTFIKKQVALIRSGRNVVAADACDDDGEEVPLASQAVGVAPTVADASGTSIGKPGGGVDEDEAATGKGVTGTDERQQDEVGHEDDDRIHDREEEGGSEESTSESESGSEEEQEAQDQEEQQGKQHEEEQLEGELEVEVEDVEMEDYGAEGAEETGERAAEVEYEKGEGKGATAELRTEKEEVGVEAAHGGSGMVVVGDGTDVVDHDAVGHGDIAAATKQTGVEVPIDVTAEKAGGERSRKKKSASGHPGSTAAGRQARLDVVKQLRGENRRLRADNARLERQLGEQTGRVDALAADVAGLLDKLKKLTAQVAETDRKSVEHLKEATSTMGTTITEGLTDNMDSAIQAGKSFAELARLMLLDLDDPEGRMAVARATAVDTLVEHVTAEVGEARKGLEETVIKYISAAQTNIAAAVSPRLVVQQPPPTAPAQALSAKFLKSFKEDVLKAVTETTQQSFLASG
ncbi:unnamed protein product [Closterium sp. NIES-65]|nr:unnamed protein product [Closterium sp. NIES-65]